MHIFVTSYARVSPEAEPAAARFAALAELTGQADFIVTDAQPETRACAEHIARLYKCADYVDYRAEASAPDGADKLLKAVNKLIGKERLLLYLDAGSCGRAISAMTGAPHGELPPGSLALVRFKGFVLPGQGALEWVKEF